MVWSQAINPLGSPELSALIAGIPVILLFITLAGLRMKGHVVGL